MKGQKEQESDREEAGVNVMTAKYRVRSEKESELPPSNERTTTYGFKGRVVVAGTQGVVVPRDDIHRVKWREKLPARF